MKSKILLIGEFPPPFAGIGVQTKHLYDIFLEKNISVTLIPISQNHTGVLSYLNNIKYLRGIAKLLHYLYNLRKIFQTDIVHVLSSSGLNFYLFSLPALFVSKLLRKKTIIHYHGGSAKDFFSTKKWLLNISSKLTDRLVVPSGFLEEVFNSLNQKSSIIPNAIDLDKFKFRKRSNISPLVLSARNLTHTYNICCTIRAFKILYERMPGAKLIIAGSGPEEKNLHELSYELGLDNAVTFAGNIPNNKMIDLYNSSDILINTSNIDNMPVSILEAQAMGLVIVTTNPGGIPYMIENHINGYIENINDYQMLGEALISAVNNQTLSLSMISHGKQHIEKMDSKVVLKKWLDLYEEI